MLRQQAKTKYQITLSVKSCDAFQWNTVLTTDRKRWSVLNTWADII